MFRDKSDLTVIKENTEKPKNGNVPVKLSVMSPYEFTSKTHSLSTEGLGKFFKNSTAHCSHAKLEGLCLGFRVNV